MKRIILLIGLSVFILSGTAIAAPSFSFSNLKLYDLEGSEEQSFALDTAAIKPCPNSDSLEDEPFRELSLIRVDAKNNLNTQAFIERIRWSIPGVGSSNLIQLHYLMPSKMTTTFDLPFSIANPTDTGKILFGSNIDLDSLGFKNVKLVIRSRDGSGNKFVHRLHIGIHFAAINRCQPN
jgi:hypothetical protein